MSSTSTPQRGRSIRSRPSRRRPLESGSHVDLPAGQVGLDREDDEAVVGLYRATVTLKSGGSAGTLKISVQAIDAKGKLEQHLPAAAALVGPPNGVSRWSRGNRTGPHRTTPYYPHRDLRSMVRPWTVPRVDRMSQPGQSSDAPHLSADARARRAGRVGRPGHAAAPAEPGPTAPSSPDDPLRGSPAHADDRIDFAPGGRVTVGFTPRASDHWKVGGVSPRALPAGRLDGRQLREQDKPAKPKRLRLPRATPAGAIADTRTLRPSERPPVRRPWPEPRPPRRRRPPAPTDPASVVAAEPASWSSTDEDAPLAPSAAVSSRGSAARSSGSCPTGSSATARRRSTSRRSRRSPTSASGSTRPATSRSATATGRRPSAGAAGRARR